MERNQIAFISLGASCIVGAFLIARLERRVQRLEVAFVHIHDYLDADFQQEVDEKFEEIVEKIDED